MNEERQIEVLESNGWTQRFIASEPRLSEAIEIYRDAGFEVRLEPLSSVAGCETCDSEDAESTCRVCFEGYEDQYSTIYTRPRKTHS